MSKEHKPVTFYYKPLENVPQALPLPSIFKDFSFYIQFYILLVLPPASVSSSHTLTVHD